MSIGILSSRKNKYRAMISLTLFIVTLVATPMIHTHCVAERKARRALRPQLLPVVTQQDLGNAATLTRFAAKGASKTIVIATPTGLELDAKALRKLSFDATANIVELHLPTAGGQASSAEFAKQLQPFAADTKVVVGINELGRLAKDWQVPEHQTGVTAIALEADGTTASAATLDTLRKLLGVVQGKDFKRFPLIELPAHTPSGTLAIFYSGDGGWRGLDKYVSEKFGDSGISVVGVDSLEYFWDTKPAELAATDLAEIMQHYRQAWGIKRFVLIGYSFGADVMPALYNRLPVADQEAVGNIILLSLARQTNFEIHIEGIMGKDVGQYATGPEIARLPADKVTCLYGTDESRKSGCTDTSIVGNVMAFTGNHHFNDDYETVSGKLLGVINGP